jgi:tetratricopeptide (TPR) repeat protein
MEKVVREPGGGVRAAREWLKSAQPGIAVILALMVLGAVAALAFGGRDAGELNSRFGQACDFYEAGDLVSARAGFEALVTAGVRNGAVYYNLGNCYYKQGEMGRAVANYRRALMLSPRDEDARFNLDLLRSAVGFGDTTSAFGIGTIGEAPLRIASAREWQVVFYASYYLCALSLLALLFFGGRARTAAFRILIAFLIVSACSFAISAHGRSRFRGGSDAVVVAERTEFMSGPGAAFEELIRLSDGVELKLRARSGIWVEAQLPTGEVGWVREGDLEPI